MDWVKRMASIISSEEENAHVANDKITLFSQPALLRKEAVNVPKAVAEPIIEPPALAADKEEPMSINDDNLKTLKRLRDLPRGTNVDSRIGAIESLLGEIEIFKTLKMLRWPQGVVCPRCHSTNIIRRDPPKEAIDQRHYYICLNCKGEGSPSDFDDFTGLPISSIRALRQWMLCWYLIGFCSVTQIAKVLGISINEVIQIANLGAELSQVPKAEAQGDEYKMKDKKKLEQNEQKMNLEKHEDYTRSESRAPLKPGYKSKK